MLLRLLPISLLSVFVAYTVQAATLEPTTQGFYIPSSNGGSMLTVVDGTYPAGLHEVINIVVSSKSDPRVLDEAREAWIAALGFSSDCLGQWPDNQHRANLGDGLGTNNQTAIKRWNYGDFNFGSCQETVLGGNHFRYWVQLGSEAKSNALFLAASTEDNLNNGHSISANGYNIGRDQLVGNATTPHTAFGFTFNATATTVTGLLPTGTGSTANNTGINHGIAIDGNVTVLNVQILASNQPIAAASSATMSRSLSITLASLTGISAVVLLGSTAFLFA